MRYQKNKELSDFLRNQFLNKKNSEKRTLEEQKRYEKEELDKNLQTSD